MSRLIRAVQAVVPDFARRPLTWEDFEATCAQERLTIDVRPWRYDEQLFRRQRRIGWLSPIERQASLVGLLALIPWTNGPPYPILERAMAEDDRLTFELQVPSVVTPKARWVTFRTTLMRYRPPEA